MFNCKYGARMKKLIKGRHNYDYLSNPILKFICQSLLGTKIHFFQSLVQFFRLFFSCLVI